MFWSRFMRKLASPALYASGAYVRAWKRRARSAPFTIVLVYHRVVRDGESRNDRFAIERGTPAGVFEAQIRFMLKRFVPVRAVQVLEPPSQPMQFAVTLDDGYEDNFSVAAPILRRLGVPATFFVVSDYVGTDRLLWWEQLAEMMRATRAPSLDLGSILPHAGGGNSMSLQLRTPAGRRRAYEQLSAALRSAPHAVLAALIERASRALGVRPREQGREYPLMSWEQLRELVRQGFEVGGHTATHCNVVGADSGLLRAEIVSSARIIESRIGAPVLSFAYPYGHHERRDSLAAELLREAGCRVAFTGTTGVEQGDPDPFALPRARINRHFHFACAYNVQDALTAAGSGTSARRGAAASRR